MAKYIVFVHGLGGVIDETWGRFPEFLIDDKSIDYNVIQYGYNSPHIFKQFYKSAPTILSIANGLLTDLKHRCDLDNDDIILVGHSMGGLVIKRLLLRLKTKKLNHKIRKICFFDVPHEGSGLANAGKYIGLFNRHLKTLTINNSELDDLNEQWVDNELDKAFDILSVIDANETVVSSMSSKSIFRNHGIETINDVNHSTIVKPVSENDTVVLVLKDFIKSSRTINKYSNRASVSYNEWLRHDRRHSSEFVEDVKRSEAISALSSALEGDKKLVRISGLSGLGKSRLVLEYINSSSDISEDNILIFDGADKIDEITKFLKQALLDDVIGLVVIENCSIKLHNYISRELDDYSTKLRMVTIGFDHDEVESSIHIKLETLTTEAIKKLVGQTLPGFSQKDIEKITVFVEGYPLLALLIAERYRDDGILNGEVTEEAFVDRLINAGGSLGDEKLRILKVCSLFDIFCVEGVDQIEEKYLYGLAEATRTDFDQLITTFSERQIINKVGKFARIVPKPLAIYLAMKWWNESLDGTKQLLVTEMPESMLHSFCNQIKYLDNSEKVQSFVEGLCSKFSPFGQAELLLSKKGSRLFRGLVEVNPKATSDALYRLFETVDDGDIESISRDTRRELVWSLEMLCWHKSYFLKSAWCLFKLACFECESYSNNSVGQFSQLFRWRNSGTEASFGQRLSILHKVLTLDTEKSDIVAIEAIKEAISTHGGSRVIGTENQGTKPEMQEWAPKTWQEIFDYWSQLFDMLSDLSAKPYATNLVKDAIGHEIRGMVSSGSIGFLDQTIRGIVGRHGKYWPSAAQSIIHSLEYDTEKMTKEVKAILIEWQKLLSPDKNNFQEQIILLVLDPSRDYEKDASGELTDMAAKDAISFANELESIKELVPYLDFIISFQQQKQSWVFGHEIIKRAVLEDIDGFLTELLNSLIENESARFEFVAGCLSGLYEIDSQAWSGILNIFQQNSELKIYYSDALRTGRFGISQLMEVIPLIREGALDTRSVSAFSYGRVTNHLSENDIIAFCGKLSEIDAHGVWASLDIFNMYMSGRDNYSFTQLKPLLEKLLLSVSFDKKHNVRNLGTYHWQESVKKILKAGDELFALKLVDFLLDQVVNNDINLSVLWDNFHPSFYSAFELCAERIWPAFSLKILQLAKSRDYYRLSELLGNGSDNRKKANSIFTLIDHDVVVEWCHDESALLLVSNSLKLLDRSDEQLTPNELLLRLVDKYGNNKNLLSAIRSNFHSRSWTGSLIPYLEADKEALKSLKQHKSEMVRQWADGFISIIDYEILENRKRETEESFVRGW